MTDYKPASLSRIPSTLWGIKFEEIIYLALIGLSLIGVAITNYAPTQSYVYWFIMIAAFASASIALERLQAQFLTGAHKLIETAGKTTAMFEGAQQQVSDKGAHDLHGQGILAVAERTLDLEQLLDPIQLGHAQRAPIKAIGQDSDQLLIRQPITDQSQDHAFPARQANRPITGQAKARRGRSLRHRKAIQDAVADPFFKTQHEMGSGVQQGTQKVKAEVSALKDIRPVT